MEEKSCFLIGHADADEEIYPALLEAIEQLIVCSGVTEFFFGYHGRFDRLALRALKAAKQKHPQIHRILVLAYHPAQFSTEIPGDVDESVYPFNFPVMPRYAIVKANWMMIGHSKHLIAYVRHPGKARDFAAHAQRKGKQVHAI